MTDQPEPTEEEEQAGRERLQEEDAKTGFGHEDPERAYGAEDEEDDA